MATRRAFEFRPHRQQKQRRLVIDLLPNTDTRIAIMEISRLNEPTTILTAGVERPAYRVD